MNVYTFIRAESASYSITELCDTLGVATSGFYAWKSRPPSRTARRREALRPKVQKAFHDSRGTYGSPRVRDELVGQGEHVSRHVVAELMRDAGLSGRLKRPRRSTTDSNHNRGYAPNLLQRDFATAAPNRAWVGDVTFIPTDRGWVYLAAFLDLFSRRVVGFRLATHKRDELTITALERAFAVRQPTVGLIVHSDRGSEFASHGFRQVLKSHHAVQSMSRKANCYDNAVAESFFATLEKDLLQRTHFATERAAIAAVTDYIRNFYNPVRRHSFNGNTSPESFEASSAAAMGATAA